MTGIGVITVVITKFGYDMNLFRKEVLQQKQTNFLGTVFINTPLQYRINAIFISFILLFILLFFIFAEFSENHLVRGYLNSVGGTTQIYPIRNGVIAHCYHHQGDYVNKGDALFLIQNSYEENKPDYIFMQLKQRKKLIQNEIKYKGNRLTHLKNLLTKHFITQEAYHNKKEEITALKQDLNRVEIEIINQKKDATYLISAPVNGIVSSLSYQEGQYVTGTKPLTKIIPQNAELVAELYIPTQEAGFLEKDSPVIFHFDAYPYQQFGTVKGEVKTISQTILTDEEEDKPIRVGQPYYKVIAQLEKPFLAIYGKPKHLQHGMTFSAVIPGSKKRIYQWVLNPIYGFYGDLFV